VTGDGRGVDGTRQATANTALKPGDTVRVTRVHFRGGRHQWEGQVADVHPAHGFALNGHHVATGTPEHGWFATSESLRRWARCEQSVERIKPEATADE
jgi:hypothetical protein